MSDNECSYYVEFDYGNLMTDTIDDFYNKDEALEYARHLWSEGEIDDGSGRMQDILNVYLYDENHNKILSMNTPKWSPIDDGGCDDAKWTPIDDTSYDDWLSYDQLHLVMKRLKDENKQQKDEIKQLKLQLEKQTLSNVLDKKIPLGTKQDINEILNSVGYTE